MNLLSGGEKALTAVSLIFAIFLIKPTPFCLLDEVDAPLDEANVGRYNEMVKEMTEGLAVHPHHAQQAHDGDGRHALRRDDAGAGRLEARLGPAVGAHEGSGGGVARRGSGAAAGRGRRRAR